MKKSKQATKQPKKQNRSLAKPRRQSVKTGSNSFFKGSASKQLNYRTTTITEDEYLVDIDGSENFSVTRYPVNPGQSSTFPWLSTIAPNFEKYRFKKLEFYYKPIVSGFATGGQKGKVIFSFDTDASDPSPTSKRQMENTIPHADSTPWSSFSLNLEPRIINRLTDAHYVRSGGVPSGTDIKTYDIGTLYVGTQGMVVDSGKVGELRVRYVVDLLIPILEELSTPAPTFHVFSSYNYSTTDGAGTITDAFIIPQSESGSGQLINASTMTIDINGLGLTASGTSLRLPVGVYFVTYGFSWQSQIGAQTNYDYVLARAEVYPLLSDAIYRPGESVFTTQVQDPPSSDGVIGYMQNGVISKSFPMKVELEEKKFELQISAGYNGEATPPSAHACKIAFFTLSIWLM
jgi:hypothetical protein